MEADRPTLVLMPGLDGSGALFVAVEQLMAGSWRYQRIRYPVELPADIDAYVAYVERQITGERRVVLLAESFSGPIAIRLAARLAERVEALVLCASFATQPHVLVRWTSHAPQAFLSSLARQRWALRWFCVGRHAPDSLLDAVQTELAQLSGHTIKRRLRMLAAPDAANALAGLRIPVLLLQPRQDRLLDPWAPKRLEQLARGAHIERLDGPHFLLQADPQACWRKLADWLTLISTPSAQR
jgi:pimeloyl-ACP methyl ester carboxylesterase